MAVVGVELAAAAEDLAHAGALKGELDELVGSVVGGRASATTTAQRRTVAVPRSVSASRTDSTVRGSEKNAELT